MVNLVSSLFRDVRYGLRTLRKTPAFTAGAVVTVALTVGATTAIFSVVYGVLLRQLPYRNVEQVFWIWSDQPGRDRTPFNVPDFIDYRGSGIRFVLIGLVSGITMAAGVTRLLSSMLFGVAATDAVTFGEVAAVVAAVSVLACGVPAARGERLAVGVLNAE